MTGCENMRAQPELQSFQALHHRGVRLPPSPDGFIPRRLIRRSTQNVGHTQEQYREQATTRIIRKLHELKRLLGVERFQLTMDFDTQIQKQNGARQAVW